MTTPAAMRRARAEAKAVIQEDGTTLVPFEGGALSVLPTKEWRSSAIRALRENDHDTWAQGCLTPESYKVWRAVDPTLGQCQDFFALWNDRTGQDVGESAAS